MIRFDGASWYDEEAEREYEEERRWGAYDALLNERAEKAAQERADALWDRLREADAKRKADVFEQLEGDLTTEERERIMVLERCF